MILDPLFSNYTIKSIDLKNRFVMAPMTRKRSPDGIPNEMETVLLPLKDAGIDIFHASTRRFWLPEFEGSDMNLAGWTKKITGCPTITVGNVGLVKTEFFGTGPESIHEVMRRFKNEEFDMVAIGRPLLSDAEWPNKVHAGLNDELVDHYQGANQIYP
jgi:2,4-dienoyl-CoA reductase-like NADH-dependent reductase (Old Yellow Enzyme family)